MSEAGEGVGFGALSLFLAAALELGLHDWPAAAWRLRHTDAIVPQWRSSENLRRRLFLSLAPAGRPGSAPIRFRPALLTRSVAGYSDAGDRGANACFFPLKFQKRIARERLNAAVQAIPVDGDHHQLAGVFRRAMEASSL